MTLHYQTRPQHVIGKTPASTTPRQFCTGDFLKVWKDVTGLDYNDLEPDEQAEVFRWASDEADYANGFTPPTNLETQIRYMQELMG